MFCAAKTTALSPEAQTLFMVIPSTLWERPENIIACRAGDWPTPPWRTLPIYTSVIFSGGTFDFSRADLMATAPSLGAETVRKEPLNYSILAVILEVCAHLFTLAVGVLAALKMYASCISCPRGLVVLKCRET